MNAAVKIVGKHAAGKATKLNPNSDVSAQRETHSTTHPNPN